jgi:hypothetical protein
MVVIILAEMVDGGVGFELRFDFEVWMVSPHVLSW